MMNKPLNPEHFFNNWLCDENIGLFQVSLCKGVFPPPQHSQGYRLCWPKYIILYHLKAAAGWMSVCRADSHGRQNITLKR